MLSLNHSNPAYPWGNPRRFNALSDHLRRSFGQRLQKLSINAGFTCPNRDGTKGTGGCTFCSNSAFNPSYCLPEKSITQQIEEGIAFHRRRYRKVKSYLAYFQAYSNTYSSLENLKKFYAEALSHPLVRGLVIGTRPDCVDDDILDHIAGISSDYYVSVEYGVESCHDRTLARINRGHTFGEARDAIIRTAERGIKTGAHFIFGLPGESLEDMFMEAGIISSLPLHTVKFHQLQIIRGTLMEKEYLDNPGEFQLFEWDTYRDFIIQFLEHLNPAIMVERFSGEAPPSFLAVSRWGKKRSDEITGLIELRMEELDTWQGRYYRY